MCRILRGVLLLCICQHSNSDPILTLWYVLPCVQMAEEDPDITSNLISEVDGEEAGLASSRFTGATRLGTVERLNLINLVKLSIKRVIQFTSTQGTNIDDFSPQIQELFILLENCMRHRLKGEQECLRQLLLLWAGHGWVAFSTSMVSGPDPSRLG